MGKRTRFTYFLLSCLILTAVSLAWFSYRGAKGRAIASLESQYIDLMPRECDYEDTIAEMDQLEISRFHKALTAMPSAKIPASVEVEFGHERALSEGDFNREIYYYDVLTNSCGYKLFANTPLGRWAHEVIEYRKKMGVSPVVIQRPVEIGTPYSVFYWRTLGLTVRTALFDQFAMAGLKEIWKHFKHQGNLDSISELEEYLSRAEIDDPKSTASLKDFRKYYRSNKKRRLK